jgi:DNA-binding NarL/FixJ family response regulator
MYSAPVAAHRQGMQHKSMTRVLVVESHTATRQSICALINNAPGMRVVSDTGSPEGIVPLLRDYKADVVVLDLPDYGHNWVDAITQIKVAAPDMRIILFSARLYPFQTQQLLHAGAHGIVMKFITSDQLIAAIEHVRAGQQVVQLDDRMSGPPIPAPYVATPYHTYEALTPRERDVLNCLAYGATNKEIAAQINVAPKTVESYIARICAKLRAATRTAAAVKAVQLGIIQSAPVKDLVMGYEAI